MGMKPVSDSDVAEKLALGRASGGNMSLWRRPMLVLAAAAALVMVFVAWRAASRSSPVRYMTQEATRGTLTVIVTATGTLQPTNRVEVGSELSGIIKTVEADYNDRVQVGQILARLDTTRLEAQVTQMKAALGSARAKVLQAQATLKESQSKLEQFRKVRELSGNQVPSQTDLDAAEAAVERAKANEASACAEVNQAQAALAANESDLSKLVIRSPVNGVVLTRNVEAGQTVAASFATPTLFTIAEDLTKMELHVNVDEADIGRVAEGQRAEFTVAAYPDRRFKAVIRQARFGSSTTSGVVTYETVLSVDNSDLALRPGMTATADITVQRLENALLVPSAALRFSPPVQAENKKKSPGLVGSLIPRPPGESKEKRDIPAKDKQHRIWTMKDEKLTPVSIRIGLTDGASTQVLEGDIQPGTAVAVDTVSGEKS
jgi:HlyD family secretion protein